MKVKCQNCGASVEISGLGRKKLNIPLEIVCEALQADDSIAVAAQELGCSQGYIFGVLKANGLRLKDIMKDECKSLRSRCT